MNIDLNNNHDTYIKESRQDSKINQWYKDIGLTVRDIEQHPCFQDLAILVNIRNTFWTIMNPSEQGLWAGSWGAVYKHRSFLRQKTLKKFEQLIPKLIYREKLIAEQRTRIQSLRHANTEPLKRDQDNEAKGSHSHSLHKQTVAYESAGECPYF